MRHLDFVRPAIVAALLAPAIAGAQQEAAVITGKVTGEGGVGLFGATIAIPALNIGTQTDERGTYRLVVPAARVNNQQLAVEVRRVGYKPRTQLVTLTGGVITRDFALEINPLRLGEVVVTGAGTLSSTEKLGNARSTVDSSMIQRSNELNVVQALAAKAPGVLINAQSGQPGASSSIQIRGVKTIVGNGQPLFVVDGMPIDNRTSSTQGFLGGTDTPNRASDINPSDIESIEILKGASASAIYGARAAAGVVIITTKSGKGGPTRVSYKSTFSSDEVLSTVPLQRIYGQGNGGRSTVPPGALNNNSPLGTNDALSYGPRLAANTPTYDQFASVFTNGSTLDQVLTVSGGNERTNFYLSGGYADAKGIVVGDNDEYARTTVRVNAGHRVVDNFQLKANVSYVDVGGGFVQRGSNVSGLLLGALRTPAEFNNSNYLSEAGFHRSFRFPNPTLAQRTGTRGFDNPVFTAMTTRQQNDVGRAYGNVQALYDPFSWLKVNYTLGTDFSSDERLVAFPMGSSTNSGNGQIIRWTLNSRQLDHNLTATGSHDFSPNFAGSLTVGQALNERRLSQVFVQADNLIAPEPFRIANTLVRQTPTDAETLQRVESYFSQATLDVYDQLFFTAAIRRDGNSAYGPDNQTAVFPKFSSAWNFLKGDGTSQWGWQDRLRTRELLTFGKVRFSYGEAGAEPNPYQLESVFLAGGTFADGGWGGFNNAVQNGQSALFRSAAAGNPLISTERTKEWEYGVDIGLFRDRADLAYTRYTSRSKDVIFAAPTPPSTGFTSQARNAAEIRNRGVEIALNTRPIRSGSLEVDLNLNWSFNDNNVMKIGQEFTNIGGSFAGNEAVVVRGGRVGMIAGFDFVRCGNGTVVNNVNIDQQFCSGAQKGALYIGANGFPVADPVRRAVGDPQPDWISGLNGAVRWKKISVSGFLDVRKGGDIWNGTRGSLVAYGTAAETAIRGQTRTFGTDFYQQPVVGPGAGRAVVIDQGWFGALGGGFGSVNKQFIEDGSFVRLREITVGYTWDNAIIKGMGIGSADFRVSGRNLGLWTDYRGIDPETNLAGAEVAARGIDFFNMPLTRSYIVSVTLNR